ncbi:PREDICTED: lipoxygenase homology domain-containing protein 1-like [Priapulus caudatus]|uniref:Lipoxygenase homology domain-containing protein 1-like n=1 Tax=Priapulus caudatus TaxID=37621 RepID=A0ABM1DUQ5_PRICU|nr:PREDICTED: lipoxygenase homology domain-containing protein 1-like [Priapulus caudatus]
MNNLVAQLSIPTMMLVGDPDPTPVNSPTSDDPGGESLGLVKELGPRQLSLDDEYNVYVKTAADSHPTSAPVVHLTAYSQLSCSDEFILVNNDPAILRPDSENLFEMVLHNIRPIVKVRLRLGEGQDDWEGWHLESVRFKNKNTGSDYLFNFDQWLTAKEGGNIAAERSLTEVESSVEQEFLGCQYQVMVYTGDRWGAETDADLYVTLAGEHGETGQQWLKNSDNEEKFLRNQVDTFTVNCKQLGDLYKVTIGHNGVGHGSGVFIDRVVVSQQGFLQKEYHFPCGRWLDDGQEDGKTERELILLGISESRDIDDADLGSPSGEAPLSPGYVDEVRWKESIELRKHIILENKAINEELKFALYPRADERDYYLEAPVFRPMSTELSYLTTYVVEVYTADREAESPMIPYINIVGDRGQTGKRQLFEGAANNSFGKGQVTTVYVNTCLLGPIRQCIVGHDNHGEGEGWLLDRITIREGIHGRYQATFLCNQWLDIGRDDHMVEKHLSPSKEEMLSTAAPPGEGGTAFGGDWNIWLKLDEKQGCKDVRLYVAAYGDTGRTADMPMNPLMLHGATYQYLLTFGNIGNLFKLRFALHSNREAAAWFINKIKLKNVTSHQEFLMYPVDSLRCTADSPVSYMELATILPDVPPLEGFEYVVRVYTGDYEGAGTDAQVWLMLHGEFGDTGRRLLSKSTTNSKPFQRAMMDEFQLSAIDLGKLDHVTLEHDGHGRGAGCYINKIIVNVSLNDTVDRIFPVNRWIDEGAGDRRLDVKCPLLGDVDTSEIMDAAAESDGMWTCTVITDAKGCHEVDQWTLIAYGEFGCSAKIRLEHLLDSNNPTKFDVELGPTGRIYKIRLTYENEDDMHFRWPIRSVGTFVRWYS